MLEPLASQQAAPLQNQGLPEKLSWSAPELACLGQFDTLSLCGHITHIMIDQMKFS